MTKKERMLSTSKEQSASIWKLPLIIVGGALILFIVMLMFPNRTSKNGTHRKKTQTVTQIFTKQGELTFINKKEEFIAKFDVEIAEDEVKRELGLMGRPSMEPGQGMLFIFEKEQPVSFWMKNTMIPLDMVFLNGNEEIITIQKNATPYSEQTYPATGPVKYVVELNAGIADRYHIEVGDKMALKRTE